MKIRNITKEDLPILAKLVNDEDLCSRDDLCLEHSKMSLNDEGVITSFVIIRRNSLIDFFGGMIEADNSIDINSKYYEEGDEYFLQDLLIEEFSDKQYELICWYLRQYESEEILRRTFLNTMAVCEFGDVPIGAIWMTYEKGHSIPMLSEFYNLNNKILITVPI